MFYLYILSLSRQTCHDRIYKKKLSNLDRWTEHILALKVKVNVKIKVKMKSKRPKQLSLSLPFIIIGYRLRMLSQSNSPFLFKQVLNDPRLGEGQSDENERLR